MDDRRVDKSVSILHPRVDLEGNGPDGLTTLWRRTEGAKAETHPRRLSTLENSIPKSL